MIYSAWYFCSTIKLSTVETQDILKTIQALENEHTPFLWKKKALKQIYKYNPIVQAYLIPYLTEGLLAPGMRSAINAINSFEERQQYIEQVEEILIHLLPEKKQQSLIDLIQNLSEIGYEDAAQFVANFRLERRESSEIASLYSDITHFTLELFLLSVINCVSRTDLELITGLVRGEDALELIQNANAGHYGQLCQNLGIKLWVQSGVPFYDAAHHVLPKDWLSKPDMAEIAANLLFPDDQTHSIDGILQEAYMLKYFQKYWQKCEKADRFFWATQSTNVKDCVRCSIIIWQAILWEMALERNPKAFTIQIQKYWNAPDSNTDEISSKFRINEYQKSILPENIGIASLSELMSNVCSPWQCRNEKAFTKGWENRQSATVSVEEQAFHEFPSFRYIHNGLRAFSAVHLLQKIFLLPQERIYDCFTALLLNFGDAFSCFGARNTFLQITLSTVDNVRIAAWSSPVRAFGYYAYEILSNIGRGLVNPKIPYAIVDNIQRRTPSLNPKCIHKNKQLSYLYSSIAIQIGLHWAFESLSATGIEIDSTANTWLVNEKKSNAASLCNWLFKKYKQDALASRDAIQLDFQAFDSSFTLQKQGQSPKWLDLLREGTKKRITFNFLLLSRNPTYEEWCEVGSITQYAFPKDSYRIALTLRIQALLDSDEQATDHPWIEEWKNAMSEISAAWELSRLVRYIMIKLLKCVPKNKDNYIVLPDLYKDIITVVQEFSGLKDIFYQYQLARRLIALTSVSEAERTIGDETAAYLRGLYAKTLYRTMETASSSEDRWKWEVLLRYYLLNITDSLQATVSRNAGESLRNYWKGMIISDNALRIEQIPFSHWNPLLDRIWTVQGDKLQTVRDGISLRSDRSGKMSAWESLSPLGMEEKQLLGVVASRKKTSIGFKHELYCADGQIRTKETSASMAFDVDSLVLFTVSKKNHTNIDRVYSLNRGSFPGEQVQVSYKLSAEELRLTFSHQTNKYKADDEPKLFQLWNGDLSELFSHNLVLSGKATAEYAEYRPGKFIWLPVEQDYVHLLINVLFQSENKDRECTLTYLGEARTSGYLLFSVKAGENYALGSDCWTSESLCKIEEKLLGTQNNAGMLIHVGVLTQNQFPYLELKGESPFDDRNIRWRKQFSSDEIIQTSWDGTKWVTKSKVSEICTKLSVQFNTNRGVPDRSLRYNIQLQENGWDYQNQRKGHVDAIELRSKRLDKITVQQLQTLIALKPGDILTLRKVWIYSQNAQNYGYYQAELDSGIPVFCAAESYSFLADSNTRSFQRDRSCIVENVNCKPIRNDEEETANPVVIQNLEGKNAYSGIVAEFSPIMRSEKETVGNMILKVILDVDGEMKTLSVPISAFSVRPTNLGDPVTAKPMKNGWIFHAQRRSINVRALWTTEDHRDQEAFQVTGAFFGLINIPRLGKCMVTQDQEKPVLHLWKPNEGYQQIFKDKCGVKLGRGKVTTIGRRFSDRNIFPNAFQTNVVALQSDGQIMIGEARFGEFIRPEPNWRVIAQIRYINMKDNLYDIRRYFKPSIGSQQSKETFTDSADEERRAYYEEWLAKENNHARCQVSVSPAQAKYIQLHELSVPVDPSSLETGNTEWTNNIALEPNAHPLVSGRRYSLSDIRVKMKIVDNKWVASVQDTEPILLNWQFASLFEILDGDRIEKNFYFAGKDNTGRLYFEWGYGYYLSAKMDDVTDEYGNLIGTELFFGDRIAAFTLRRFSDSEFGWKLVVFQTDIHQEVEAQVWQDAEQQIVQILRIKKDEGRQQINILESSVKERKFKHSGIPKNGWSFKPIFNARLDSKSKRELFSKLSQNEEIIFAELNRTDFQKSSPYLEFTYIPIDGIGDALSALDNKVVCLTAGTIKKNKNTKNQDGLNFANDYKIDFFLPDEISDTDKARVRVSVRRRDFSIDESILRVLFNKKPDAYKGCNFLIRLMNITQVHIPGVWFGSVLTTPLRSTENLKAWLEKQTSNLVTVGIPNKEKKNQLCAEIFPGIIFSMPEQPSGFVVQGGALATLQLVDGEITTSIVMPGDAMYIPDRDFKPAELLIMDGILNRYSPDNVCIQENEDDSDVQHNQNHGAHFTVAGFPQLRLFNFSLLEQIVRQEPPRIAAITKNAHGNLSVVLNSLIQAGYLTVSDQTNLPTIRTIYPNESEIPSSWSCLSFKDGTVDQIAEYVRCGTWHYHDQITGVYSDETGQMQPRPLPDGQNYQDILVFFQHSFGNNFCLRYRNENILKFGMSAREIIENGLPHSVSKASYFAVAGSTDRSVWIELFPGKILEIPRAYLFIGKDKFPLSRLCTKVFTAGDELWLQKEESSYGERGRISLSGVKFGMRSAFPNGRAFLPICKEQDTAKNKNSLLLGSGFWTLQYPMLEKDKPDPDSVRMVVIDNNNQIKTDHTDLIFHKGDCVMLTVNSANKLTIIGREQLKVELSRESDWGSTQWLYRMIKKDAKSALKLFRNALPVQINGMSSDEKIVFVSYRQQDCGELSEGTTLCCNCINMYRDSEKKLMVILRSGGYLFQVSSTELINVPLKNGLEYIIKKISKERHSFFMTKTGTSWKSGLNLTQTNSEREIIMLYNIPECNGILCRDKRDLSLLWLPIEKACRVKDVQQNILWDILQKKKNLVAVTLDRSVISLNDTERSQRQYQLLTLSGNSYRVLLRKELDTDETHYIYLCEMYPTGELLLLKSESRRNTCEEAKTEDDITYVEIVQKDSTSIVAIPRKEHRWKINLSAWILSAYRQACVYNDAETETVSVDLTRWRKYIPDQFKKYSEAAQQAEADFKSKAVSDLFSLYSTEEQLVYLCCALQKHYDDRRMVGQLYQKVNYALREWLRGPGKLLTVGFDVKTFSSPSRRLDLLPAIAAIILLNRFNMQNSNEDIPSDCQKLAVHLTRMLGFACGNSIHQEVLLKLWLLRGNKRGLWSRLQRLSLGGKIRKEGTDRLNPELFDGQLTMEQKEFLDEIAGGIVFNYPERYDIRLTSMSLLHSVGEKIDYTEFLRLLQKEEIYCVKLARLGRVLTPPAGEVTAYNILQEKLKILLEDIFNSIAQKDIPMPLDLLTDILIPLPEEEKISILKLHKSACDYLTYRQRRSFQY